MHKPTALFEVIVVVQEGDDVLPADQAAGHGNIGTIRVNATSLVKKISRHVERVEHDKVGAKRGNGNDVPCKWRESVTYIGLWAFTHPTFVPS